MLLITVVCHSQPRVGYTKTEIKTELTCSSGTLDDGTPYLCTKVDVGTWYYYFNSSLKCYLCCIVMGESTIIANAMVKSCNKIYTRYGTLKWYYTNDLLIDIKVYMEYVPDLGYVLYFKPL
jgi:hypothetical protein